VPVALYTVNGWEAHYGLAVSLQGCQYRCELYDPVLWVELTNRHNKLQPANSNAFQLVSSFRAVCTARQSCGSRMRATLLLFL
jgi:hypothetical protein